MKTCKEEEENTTNLKMMLRRALRARCFSVQTRIDVRFGRTNRRPHAAISASPTSTFSSTPASHVLQVSALKVQRTATPKAKPAKEGLVFGAVTTDHMLSVDWTAAGGWGAPTIAPYGPLALDPAASALHYGIEAFEGMKAYVLPDGAPALFRPGKNMERLAASMDRLAGPQLDQAGFLDAIKAFVGVERGWVPAGEGYSLYLRPTFIATWPYLGVSPAKSFKLFVIACPVGPYYPEGFKPVSLLADTEHVRAWPGGMGAAKVGGNYAPTIKVQADAAKRGYAQVLWLFGPQHELTEVGTMNLFVFWDNAETGRRELVTPPLDGTILPGVTRDSILALARGWGEFDVAERKLTMPQLAAAADGGRLREVFGAGTAAVVSPVKSIHYAGRDIAIPLDPANPSAGAGPLAARLWDALRDIQYGRPGSEGHPWCVRVGDK